MGVNAETVEDLIPTAAQSSQIATASPLTNDADTSSISTPVGIDSRTLTPKAHSQYVESVQTLTKSSSTKPRPSDYPIRLKLPIPRGKASLSYGKSTSIPSPAIETQSSLMFGTQTITGTSKSQHVSPSAQSLALVSIITVGSERSVTALTLQASSGKSALIRGSSTSSLKVECTKLPDLVIGSQTITADDQNHYVFPSGHVLALSATFPLGSGISTTTLASGTQNLLVSGSSASLLPHASATPAISQIPLPLTISGQTMTANSLGQYIINGQTLMSGGMITVSGTKTSLAPHASDIVVGMSTKALTANITAAFSSGPKLTGGQTFEGSTLGARDELWSSSVVVLVGIAVLLWL